MNRDVINAILNEVESLNAAFASGKMNGEEYQAQRRILNMRLGVYGLALAGVAVTPPF